MKLALVASPRNFETVEYFSLGIHLVLAAEVLVDTKYEHFYKQKSRQGHFIICDNGAAEYGASIDFDEVLRAADVLDADEVALPDVLRNKRKTLELHCEYANTVPEKNRMAIPQGNSVEEWIDCLEELIDTIDFRTIGIPKLLDDYRGGRLATLKYLEHRNWHTSFNVHLLGCNKAPLQEIRNFVKLFPWIRSIDTAAPFAYAQSNQSVVYTKHLSYNWQAITENQRLVNQNVISLLDACKGV